MYKQFTAYFFLLIITCIVTCFAYFHFREKWILFHKGEALYSKRKFQVAIDLYQKAFSLGIRDYYLYIHLGDSYLATKQFPEAIALYKNYLEEHPKDREMRIRLARILSYTGNYEESSEEYEKSIKNR